MKNKAKLKAIKCPECGVKMRIHNNKLACINCIFIYGCTWVGLPPPQREYRFVKDRLWKFDYCWINHGLKLAVELEGATMINGRHTRGVGFLADTVKYNRAIEDGWTILRYPTFPITVKTKNKKKEVTKTTVYKIDYDQIKQVYEGLKNE